MHTIKTYFGHMKKDKRGFTLFVALVVSSILLAVGLSLGDIALKQLVFASAGSDSQVAFYAADSGAECGLYWDRKSQTGDTVDDGAFSTSTTDYSPGGPMDILCGTVSAGANLPKVGKFEKVVSTDQNAATTTFSVNYSDDTAGVSACAEVLVAKWIDLSGPYPVEHTTIDSRGYNAPLAAGTVGINSPISPNAAQCDTSGARVTERAVRLDY